MSEKLDPKMVKIWPNFGQKWTKIGPKNRLISGHIELNLPLYLGQNRTKIVDQKLHKNG